MNKYLKIALKVLLGILIGLVIFLIFVFINHKYQSKKEYEYLNSKGYINLVSAGDYNLNVYKYGNENGKHKLVGLSGLGVHNYQIEMKYALEGLEEDNQIIFIDRAGYGYSDDTNKKQTVEQIVNDYRTALKNAGVEAPYILVPHSLGGMYATYWESMYPDEIEAVIFVDTSEIDIDVWEDDYMLDFSDRLGYIATQTGLQRLILDYYTFKLPSNYSKEDQKITDYLNTKSFISKAYLSEREEMNNNTNRTVNNIVKNDIPKVFIDAETGFTTKEEAFEFNKEARKRQKELGMKVWKEFNDEDAELFLKQCEEWRNTHVIPYIEKLGNTKLAFVPGSHMIFEDEPEKLNKTIKEFIDELN